MVKFFLKWKQIRSETKVGYFRNNCNNLKKALKTCRSRYWACRCWEYEQVLGQEEEKTKNKRCCLILAPPSTRWQLSGWHLMLPIIDFSKANSSSTKLSAFKLQVWINTAILHTLNATHLFKSSVLTLRRTQLKIQSTALGLWVHSQFRSYASILS